MDDPSCQEQGFSGCLVLPSAGGDTQRASGKGLIIGLVVGIGGAAILFAVLVGSLLWCKSNKRGLWKPEEGSGAGNSQKSGKNSSGSGDFSMTASQQSSTQASTTASGVELTTQSALTPSVQGVNNHTQVEDKTLPSHIKAYNDDKGNTYYVNNQDMTTSWTHPNSTAPAGDNGAGPASYGW